MSLNYEYLLQRAVGSSSLAKPRVLDFGSGQGQLMALALAGGVDIWGVDVPGIEVSDRAMLAIDGKIPYGDNAFDVVVSNQVFEHIAAPLPALKEIARVLKPGGAFIAIFPGRSAWFEGHVGLYFVHRLVRFPRALDAYLRFCHRLGFGYFRDGGDGEAWAGRMRTLLETEVYYHPRKDLDRWWLEAFGAKPESLARDWMLFRIARSRRFRPFLPVARPRLMEPLLAFVCHARAGLVLWVRKAG